MSPEPVELHAARLDAELAADPRAALERFALAAELGDDDALMWVIGPDDLDRLPWSVRARAERIVAHRAALDGDLAAAEAHLRRVYPEDPGYAEARIELGDLLRARGALSEAVRAYRDAGDIARAHLGIARVYAAIGRFANAGSYAQWVYPGDPDWAYAQVLRASYDAAGDEPRVALGTLVSVARPSIAERWWLPEVPAVAAAAYRALCHEEDAAAIEAEARPRLEAQRAWLAARLEQPTDGLWTSARTGPLPDAFWDAFEDRAAPVLQRLERIEALPPSEIRAERREHAQLELGWRLGLAYQEAWERLGPVSPGGPEDPRILVWSEPVPSQSWPFTGEYWADEVNFWVGVRSECP